MLDLFDLRKSEGHAYNYALSNGYEVSLLVAVIDVRNGCALVNCVATY